MGTLGCGVPAPSVTVTVSGFYPLFRQRGGFSAFMALEVSAIANTLRFARQSCAVEVFVFVTCVTPLFSLIYWKLFVECVSLTFESPAPQYFPASTGNPKAAVSPPFG